MRVGGRFIESAGECWNAEVLNTARRLVLEAFAVKTI